MATMRCMRICRRVGYHARYFSNEAAPKVFNSGSHLIHRQWAAQQPDSSEYDYLRDAIATQVVDRLNDITREFPTALDLGANTGNVAKALSGHGEIKKLFMLEPSRAMLMRDEATWKARTDLEVIPVEGAIEGRLPFDDASMDIVLSSGSLHWVNDIQAVFNEAKRVLKPDGVFLGALLGGETLRELRTSFAAAEMERDGGLSPHTSPFLTVPDIGNMLSAVGFGLPTIDAETFTIEYPSAAAVFDHLQRMGESNASLQMRPGMRPSTLAAAAAAYQGAFGNPDGSVTATFQVIHFIGWAPAASQPKPLRRGSVSKGFGARGGGPPPAIEAMK